jgi:hypothetical protein
VATVDPIPTAPTVTDGQHCGPGTVDLSASASDPVSWFDVPSGGTSLSTGNNFTTPIISATTTYYVQSNNGVCASNRIAVTATILNLPVINLGPDTNIIGTTFQIDAGTGFVSYNWSNGLTTQSITVNTPDTFCVTVTDANNCSNTDCIFVDFSNSIFDSNESNAIMVYPNPSSGIMTINLPDEFNKVILNISDVTGQLIYSREMQQPIIAIDLSASPKGVYFITIISDTGILNKKIILE